MTRIISLNIWGGRVREPLLEFIRTNASTADIFCFQEVYHDAVKKTQGDFTEVHLEMFDEMQKLLPNHIGKFCPVVEDYFGIATFVHKNFQIKASGDIDIYENPAYTGMGGNHSRKGLWVDIEKEDKTLSILNVHGLWTGKGKGDTPERLEQSRRIRAFMDAVKGPQVLCGDFNLWPDTESVAILEKGMQNLIKEHGINSTRTSYYKRAAEGGSHADYAFISPEIHVSDFKVMPEEVSDHAALQIDIAF